MAIVTATRTTYDEVLRIVYTPKLWELQNRDRILLQMLSRDTAMYAEGKQINVRLHIAGTGGVGWSGGGTLPTAGVQVYDEAVANYKRLYGTFKIDGALIRSTREPRAAELKALEGEARGLVEDIANALAYDIWQDGTAKLGSALTTPDAGVSTTSFRIPKLNNGIRLNDIIDVSEDDGTVTEGKLGLLVTDIKTDTVDSAKFLVTVDGILAGTGDVEAATYFAYRQGSRDDAIHGINGIIDDGNPGIGNYLGIDRGAAGKGFWKAQVLDNGGTNREVTLTLLQEMRDLIENNSPGTPKLIICGHAIWRKIAEILVPDKRYGGDMYKLKGWCQAVDFAGIPVVRDKFAIPNKIFFFDLETWMLYQDSEGGFIDEDGLILHRVSGSDAFEAAWRRFLQPVCSDPASNGVIKDISQ